MIKRLYFRDRPVDSFGGSTTGSVTVASCDYGDLESKRSDEDIAGRDGVVASHAGGRHFKARQITIVLNVIATPTTLKSVITSIETWFSEAPGTLWDEYEETTRGWVFTNAEFVSSHVDYLDMFRGAANLTIKMTADPRMERPGRVNECVMRFSVRGSFKIAASDNEQWQVWGNTDGQQFSMVIKTCASPYTYRLKCYTENTPALTVRGETVQPGELFTLPRGLMDYYAIEIEHTGYGWYELWHDTREVRT